ncbi:hypothetical protein Agub_g5981 [Astrephomene gubernaculifera]|uniref:Uncharacterized protein n=1 Tax=Astrephomene gubernaculifera TaxID=47775 RepID=A0AAD3DMN2_9CHLO|nr:hypothetical protein Agub_g5981 [Astrephomene gubernaculifera]
MGCGSSKGAAEVTPTALRELEPEPGTEFTPENKPRQPEQSDDQVKVKESREVAKRVDNIVKSSGVSAFDDDGDAKQDTTATPVVVRAVAAQPPPPSTPPVSAYKSPAEKSQSMRNNFITQPPGPTAEEALDSPYFPEQVTLDVGSCSGGAVPSPTQPLALVPSASSRTPSSRNPLPAPLTVEPQQRPQPDDDSTSGATALQPSTSLQPATSLQPFEAPPESASTSPMPTASSARHQHALQPLPESPQLPQQLPDPRPPPPLPQQPTQSRPHSGRQGPALLPPPAAAQEEAAAAAQAAAAPPPPAADDPWSSLQSQYRIRQQSGIEAEPGRPGGGGGGGGSGGGGIRGSARGRGGALRGIAESSGEMLVLGADDDDFYSGGGVGRGGGGGSVSMGLNSTGRSGGRGAGPLTKPGSQPKKGGWGTGQMARAGELMLGEDDWLETDRPPPGVGAGAAAQQQGGFKAGSYGGGGYGGGGGGEDAGNEEDDEVPAPQLVKKQGAKDDVQFEDIEDVDTLLEDELEQKQGISNKDLASKLAAYEAQFGDDDDQDAPPPRKGPKAPAGGPRTWTH